MKTLNRNREITKIQSHFCLLSLIIDAKPLIQWPYTAIKVALYFLHFIILAIVIVNWSDKFEHLILSTNLTS